MDKSDYKKTQVWTPDWLVVDMINCIPGDIKNYKILDLCAGPGTFSKKLIEFGVNKNNITALEIDPDLCEECKKLGVNVICCDYRYHVGKYDIVISNPPYQVEDGGYGKSARPIYHKIVCHAIDHLAPQYICMITPSRWMVGGKGLDDYRARMLADKRIRMITDYPGEKDVFSSVIIKGGVSYFLWDRNYSGPCEFDGVKRFLNEFDVIVRDNTSISILNKVLKKHPAGQFCNERVLPTMPFGLPTNFNSWVPEGTEGAVKCYARNQEECWVRLSDISDTHNVLKKWKVCTSRSINPNKKGHFDVYNSFFIVEAPSACTETYLVAGFFSTKKEATNYASYMNTRFYRFMLSLRVISQDISKQKFAWVPDFMDYSVEYTDQYLYEHFGLTKHEIDHIEKTIKSLV